MAMEWWERSAVTLSEKVVTRLLFIDAIRTILTCAAQIFLVSMIRHLRKSKLERERNGQKTILKKNQKKTLIIIMVL